MKRLQQEDKNISGKLNYKLERGRRMIMYCKYSHDECLQYERVHVRHFGASMYAGAIVVR